LQKKSTRYPQSGTAVTLNDYKKCTLARNFDAIWDQRLPCRFQPELEPPTLRMKKW